MRIALLGLMVSATLACNASHDAGAKLDTDEAALAQCKSGQTVLYSKMAPPSAGEDGASGIADAPAVLSGKGSSGEGTSPTTAGTGKTATGSSTPSSPATSTAPFASTSVSCVPAVCPADQVAVPKLSMAGGTSESAGGVEEGPPSSGPSSSSVDPPASPHSGTATPTSTPTTTPTPDGSGATASDVLCVEPPLACPASQAPSYAPAGYWHCMPLCDVNDPTLVVISYGGTFGNGGVCAGPPPQHACPTKGQVWTWDFTSEDWDCEAECDNGQYDQHTYGNQVVCVPC